MNKQAEKDEKMNLSESDLKFRQEFEKYAKEAKKLSDKFARAQIIDESILRRHMTI